MTVRFEVEIDQDRCIGNGDCADLAPDVFAVGDVAERVGDGTCEQLCAAAAACPSHAIRVIDPRTGAHLF